MAVSYEQYVAYFQEQLNKKVGRYTKLHKALKDNLPLKGKLVETKLKEDLSAQQQEEFNNIEKFTALQYTVINRIVQFKGITTIILNLIKKNFAPEPLIEAAVNAQR